MFGMRRDDPQFIGGSADVRFAFVAYAQEIPDEGRAAMRAEAQAAIARAEA